MGSVIPAGKTVTIDPLLGCMPKDGWIGKYLKWTDHSEPPRRYRFAVALGLISAALNRKVYIPFENRGTYPNLWVLLMGPSGCGKDSAIHQGYELFMRLETRPKVIAEKITPEALIKTLASFRPGPGTTVRRDSKGVVFAPELSTFLGRTRYNEGMITLLTRLYDCPSELPTETIVRQNVTLYDVSLTMLWGSTPDWYARYMPDGAMCGGFMSRIFYVFYIKREMRLPNPPPFNEMDGNHLVNWLAEIGRLEGPMRFDNEASQLFEDWYYSLPDPDDGEAVSGYTARKPLTVKKIAMILAAAESRDMLIYQQHVQNAIDIVNIIGEQLETESGKMGSTQAAQLTDYVAGVIAKKPDGMLKREISQRTYRKIEGQRDVLERILDWLVHMDIAEQFRDDRGRIWYKIKEGIKL